MEDSNTDQTQTAELHILASYNGFLTLILFTSLPLVLSDYYQLLWWRKLGYSTEGKCFVLEIWTTSVWSQSHTPVAGVPSRSYVLLRSVLWSHLLYWKQHSANMRLPLVPLWVSLHLWAAWSVVVKCTRRYTGSWGCQFYFTAVQNGFCNKFLLFIYLLLPVFNAEIYLFSILTLSSLLLVFFSSSWVNFSSERLFLPNMPGNEWHVSIGC